MAALLACWAASPHPSSAETCPPMAGGEPALAELDPELRLDFIRTRLAEESLRTRRWTTGWEITYGLLAGAQLALIPILDDPGRTVDLAVGAGGAVIGLGALLALPLEANRAPEVLEGRIASGALERCALLAQAEQLLREAAEGEAFGKGLLVYGGNVLLNIGLGLTLGLGFDRWQSAALNMSAGIVVGALMILTQPDGLGEVLQDYLRGELTGELPAPAARYTLTPIYAPHFGGLRLSVVF